MSILLNFSPELRSLIEKMINAHGRPYLVGGAVRDAVMKLPMKDIDIEVHGLSENAVENILQECGPVSTVGKSFGVLRVHGLDVDWSLPRSDSAGRKPSVIIDPMMSIEQALRRRDLTMNAIAIDLKTEQLIDPFNGVHDIQKKIIRTPDARLFVEDPLRFYRVMQFVSRFEMYPDDELNALCARIDIACVSRERIEQEFKKMLLLSRRPSLGIRWMHSMGRLKELFPELEATVQVAQSPEWHPEGSVFEHSMQSLDAAATIVKTYDNERNKLIILYAALCHDLGKTTTTTHDEHGRIRSFGHEKEVGGVKAFLKKITHDGDLVDAIISLIMNHMTPLQLVAQQSSLSAYKRLANRLHNNVSISLLSDLVDADRRGRNGASSEPLPGPSEDVLFFVEMAKKAGVFEAKEPPILTGSDLLPYIQPGPAMGRLLKKAYEIQIDDNIHDKKVLLERVLGREIN